MSSTKVKDVGRIEIKHCLCGNGKITHAHAIANLHLKMCGGDISLGERPRDKVLSLIAIEFVFPYVKQAFL